MHYVSSSNHYQERTFSKGFYKKELNKDTAKSIFEKDHSTVLYTGDHRHGDFFKEAMVVFIDIDNTTENKCSIKEFQERFKDYYYYLSTSKSHNKEKKSNSGEIYPIADRFHVYFPLENPITDLTVYKDFLTYLTIKYPYMDADAKNCAQLVFGVKDGIIIINDGKFLPLEYEVVKPVKDHKKESIKPVIEKPVNAEDPLSFYQEKYFEKFIMDPENRLKILEGLRKAVSIDAFRARNDWVKLAHALDVSGFSVHDFKSLSDQDEYTQAEAERVWNTKSSSTKVQLGSVLKLARLGDPNLFVKKETPVMPQESYYDTSCIVDYSDKDNTIKLAQEFGNSLRYCTDDKKWVYFDGRKWTQDHVEAHRQISAIMQMQIRKINNDIATADDKKEKNRLYEIKARLNNMKSYSSCKKMAECEMPITSSAFNNMNNHFPVKNGIIDLKTGELLPKDPAYLFTFCSDYNYDPNAQCPKFKEWLLTIMKGRESIVDWLRVLFGYCLTGNTGEHIFPVFYGRGGNGKGTLVNIITDIMAGASTSIPVEIIIEKKFEDSAHYALASLQGKRFVYAAEPEEGKKFDTGTIKTITGGDLISCRMLYGDFKSYKPTWKIILQANDKPVLSGQDVGMWRRLRLIPFDLKVDPSEAVKDLYKDFLEEEGDGILNWIVQGALWYNDNKKLPYCAEIERETNEYREDSNTIQNFINERLRLINASTDNTHDRTQLKDMLNEYTSWARENGQPEYKGVSLTRELVKAGIHKERGRSGMYFKNVIILQDYERVIKAEEMPMYNDVKY